MIPVAPLMYCTWHPSTIAPCETTIKKPEKSRRNLINPEFSLWWMSKLKQMRFKIRPDRRWKTDRISSLAIKQ